MSIIRCYHQHGVCLQPEHVFTSFEPGNPTWEVMFYKKVLLEICLAQVFSCEFCEIF